MTDKATTFDLKDQKKSKKKQKQLEVKMKNKSTKSESTKPKIKRADEIISRVKWDPQLMEAAQRGDFIIVYLDRFTGLQETTIELFEEENLIPMHRIYYFKMNGKIVWDRKKRIDRVSTGEIYNYLDSSQEDNEADDNDTHSGDDLEYSSSDDHDDDDNDDNDANSNSDNENVMSVKGKNNQKDKEMQTTINNPSSTLVPHTLQKTQQLALAEKSIIFSTKKNRHIFKIYKPEDYLESWMLEVNDREKALDFPTHISQRGGQYHIKRSDMDQLYKMWAKSVESGEKFYMEEFRTDLFRLYVDVDIKLTEHKPYNIIEHGWIPVIIEHARKFFVDSSGKSDGVDFSPIVTECHGEWTDSMIASSVYKSGYRIYFPSIIVNLDVLHEFVLSLSKELESRFNKYKGQPADWNFTDVVDVASCKHCKGRMYGTVKFRRGEIISRKYSFAGQFDANDGTLNQEKTNQLKQNLIELLRSTCIRYSPTETLNDLPDSQSEAQKFKPIHISTKLLSTTGSIPKAIIEKKYFK